MDSDRITTEGLERQALAHMSKARQIVGKSGFVFTDVERAFLETQMSQAYSTLLMARRLETIASAFSFGHLAVNREVM